MNEAIDILAIAVERKREAWSHMQRMAATNTSAESYVEYMRSCWQASLACIDCDRAMQVMRELAFND